jgi:hypothetical protein
MVCVGVGVGELEGVGELLGEAVGVWVNDGVGELLGVAP